MTATRTFTFLGTGTSVGVPMVGCDCETCTSSDPRNHRYRCSVLIATPHGNILIDAAPELRLQLLRARVSMIHALLLTHYHYDHMFGLDDVRPMLPDLGVPLPTWCNEVTERLARQVFAYAFGPEAEAYPLGAVPRLTFHRVEREPFEVLGQRIVPVPLKHARQDVLGFRFDGVAYCTDVSLIPDTSWPLLEGLDVLVLDALRSRPHPGHFSLAQALDVIAQLKPRQAYLTHMTHELEHEATNRRLPPGVELAYDGLSFAF